MKIRHDHERHQFVGELGSYHAVLMYAERDGVLDFYHVYIPDPFRKRGLAGALLKRAFEYARLEQLQVVPTCPFIAGDFLSRFPEYRELTVTGEFPFAQDEDTARR